MKRVVKILAFIVPSVLFLVAVPGKIFAEAYRVDYAGYSGCIRLENENTRVILESHCGGRVLEYSWKGKNVIKLDPKQDGWIYKPGDPEIDPYGGRFDIGPEMIVPKHPELWLGPWKAEITGSYSARLISIEDKVTGVQLIREFTLDKGSSHLRCTQIIKNVSKKIKEYCHWSRTLVLGGGICVVPLTPESRFPHRYIMYGPGPVINYEPVDPHIRVRDGFLEIIGPPANSKLGMDSYVGLLIYLLPDDCCFVKKFSTYPDKVYNEIAAITVSIYYYQNLFCELEPIGPRERLKPGQSSIFTEDWWLLSYEYPEEEEKIDLNALTEFVQQKIKSSFSF